MSEKSFAVASVSVAVIWGTFFYPPMPHKTARVDANLPVSAGVSVDTLRADKGALRPANAPLRPVALNTALPDSTSRHDCAFTGAQRAANCPPLHKLAGD
jgi:hypothetical protein